MILYGNNKLFLRVEAAKEIEKIRRDWVKIFIIGTFLLKIIGSL